MKKLAFVVAAVLALGACTTAPDGSKTVDQASVNSALDKVEIAYTGAVAAVTLFCTVSPHTPPCNSPDSMNKISAAKAVLTVALAKVRDDIAAAQTEDAVSLAVKSALDAVQVYAEAVRQLGLKVGD